MQQQRAAIATTYHQHLAQYRRVDDQNVLKGAALTVEDARDYDGEQRFNTTGLLGVVFVTICHTESEDEMHIISMRKAEPHEIDTLARYL